MTDTANLALPCIEGSQAQKHVTHNEALRLLDTLVQLAVLDRDLTAPPGSPAEGQRWIVKAGATGAWSGRDDAIAAWQDGAWQFSTPKLGWTAFVADEGTLLVWNGSAWGDFFSTVTAIQNLAMLGIGTTADATNVLSAKLNCALFAARSVAEGGTGDLRYKLSKEAAANTLSFLFQDNYSGRAEIGLTGDDDFHFKVSPDGTAWVDALKLNKTTGAATLAASASASAFVPSGSSLPANGVYLPAANTIGMAANSTQILTGTSTTISIKPTTASTSTSTGALTVAGGIGAGSSIRAPNYLVGSSATSDFGSFGFGNSAGPGLVMWGTGSAGAGAMEFYFGGSKLFQISGAGNISALATTASTAASNGAMTLAGGLGVAGAINGGGGIASASGSAGVGYATGAGGTVTQATSKSTGVTLNKVTGAITMHNASLAAQTAVGFTLTNSAIAASDLVVVNIKSGASANSYTVTVAAVTAGSCVIELRNYSAGALGEAVVLAFAVVKGAVA